MLYCVKIPYLFNKLQTPLSENNFESLEKLGKVKAVFFSIFLGRRENLNKHARGNFQQCSNFYCDVNPHKVVNIR